ncbi:MAG: ankyrin repeat domain-containing protein, partial [Spirochaetota bacterium]
MTKSAKLQILFLVHVCLFVATGCTRESTSDSDVPPEHRNTFLLNAIVDHDLDTVRELLPESGVKPEDVNFETMYYYQEHGAEIPLTPLILAVIEADPRIVSYLITRGADVNLPLKESGATPVMFAATSDNEEALRILIDNGADIDYSAVHNTSVLQWAVRSDKP